MKLLRRALSTLLLALFSFMLIGPALFSADETNLPACCRKTGKHHCGMAGNSDPTPSSGVHLKGSGKCPFYPATSATPLPSLTGRVPARHSFSAGLFLRPYDLPCIIARYRTPFSRSRQKRGPPADSLLFA